MKHELAIFINKSFGKKEDEQNQRKSKFGEKIVQETSLADQILK